MDAREIVQVRLAKGEITAEEYSQLLSSIEGRGGVQGNSKPGVQNTQLVSQGRNSPRGNDIVYASFGLRAVAFALDGIISQMSAIIVAVLASVIIALLFASEVTEQTMYGVGQLLGIVASLLVQWLYFTMFESSAWQATPAKRLLKLRVTDMSMRRVGFGQANVRYWSKILSALILAIGYLMAAFTQQKQALHDKLAKTLVIKAG